MAGLFDISGWFIPLARRLLYAWVRTTVFPEDVATLGLDPSKPVCYVLQNRHLSNLLVLFEESRNAGLPPAEASIRIGRLQSARSFFFLNRSRAVVSTGRERNAHSPLLEGLVRESVTDSTLDVQLVPVVILWGRSPDKQESILKALFSETWRAPGPLNNRGQTTIVFCQSIPKPPCNVHQWAFSARLP